MVKCLGYNTRGTPCKYHVKNGSTAKYCYYHVLQHKHKENDEKESEKHPKLDEFVLKTDKKVPNMKEEIIDSLVNDLMSILFKLNSLKST